MGIYDWEVCTLLQLKMPAATIQSMLVLQYNGDGLFTTPCMKGLHHNETYAINAARWDDEGSVLIRVAGAKLWMLCRVARAANDRRRRRLLLSTRYHILPPDERLTTDEHQEQHVESKTILVQGFLGGHHVCLQVDNPRTSLITHLSSHLSALIPF